MKTRVRALTLSMAAVLLLACHPTIDVAGIYVADHDEGAFFPCDDPKAILRVPDTALAARYRLLPGAAQQPAYAHLRGVRSHAGSVYGGPQYFVVQQVIELRARREGECPRVGLPVSPLFVNSATSTP